MKYLDVEIRPMLDSDLPQVMEIENLCFLHPYKEKDILYELHENPVSTVLVIEYTAKSLGLKQVVGFVDYWITFDSATICQICVNPLFRRKGLGSMMIDELVSDCKANRVRNITLEVRENNDAAIKLYEKNGFKKSLVKEAYYTNGDNAVYMIRELEY